MHDVHRLPLGGLGSYTAKVCILSMRTCVRFLTWNEPCAFLYCCHDPDGYVSYAAFASSLSYKKCIYTARIRLIISAVSIRITFIPEHWKEIKSNNSYFYLVWIWTEVWIPYSCKSLLYSHVQSWPTLPPPPLPDHSVSCKKLTEFKKKKSQTFYSPLKYDS